jgi:hypothetical protein
VITEETQIMKCQCEDWNNFGRWDTQGTRLMLKQEWKNNYCYNCFRM